MTVNAASTAITIRMTTDPGALTTVGLATFIPLDIQAAVCEAVSTMRNQMQYGGPMGSETLGDYNYSIAFNQATSFGTVRQMLAPYRDVSAGIALA
jgi:hypothetical protein